MRHAAAVGLLALVPLHFLFFEVDYFGDYHRRAAFWFDWNHRDGLEAIIAREAGDDRPIVLSNGDDPLMAAYWRFAVLNITGAPISWPDPLCRREEPGRDDAPVAHAWC